MVFNQKSIIIVVFYTSELNQRYKIMLGGSLILQYLLKKTKDKLIIHAMQEQHTNDLDNYFIME